MAELDAAAELELLGDATGTIGVEHIDETALLGDRITPPSTTNGVKKEDVDLYDDAIAPSGGDKGVDFVTAPARSTPTTTSTNTITASVSYTSEGKKYCCYVGNLTWWTTEADLTLHIAAVGVNDLLELKFFENRINGQSKGYALLIFGSDSGMYFC